MSLLAGVRLGAYDVVELIGMGGMGEVYRARDARLNRDVALKILPALFVGDPDRLARFRREAQVLASLNHSNIGAIYGFEEADGAHALVLELVDGPTLAERIAEGRIPPDDALPIATQIAEALEAAHERGIVHRDLKPANIKVRADGTVKVLDFGLAKALTDEVGAAVSQSPTITSPALTRMGVILGTAAYMSPEQARGRSADKRSDIWAFGCVLYEMLTGTRAFEGSEVSDTLASILKSEPDWSVLPADTSPTIRRVLRRCLEKDPRRRYHDIADTRLDLDERAGADGASASGSRSTHVIRERAAWALAAVSLMSLVSVLAYVTLKEPAIQEVTRFQIYPPENTVLTSVAGGMAGMPGTSSGTVSPDGTRLVFAATDRSGRTVLWVRPLDSFAAQPIAGSDGASLPFWSPDGRSIGFFVGNKLKRVDGAGAPQTVCDVTASPPRGGTWGTGGDILFGSGNSPRIYRVSDKGGAPMPLGVRDERGNAIEASWPYFLPDGRHFLFWVRSSAEGARVLVASIEPGTESRRLVASDTNAVYAPPGFLLFMRNGTLLRQRFDPERLKLTGETTPVAEQIAHNLAGGLAAFSVSSTGVLTFQSSASVSSQFAWFDRGGHLLKTVGPPGSYRAPALSPDGKHLAYTDVDTGDIWLLDMVREIPSRFTSNSAAETAPVWSLDGGKILYRSIGEDGGFFEKSASGAVAEQLFFKGVVNGPSQVSPDGTLLLYFANPAGQSVQDIFVLPMTGERKPRPIVQTPFAEVEPQLSADGRWLAYASNETGQYEVYVQPFPATGERWKISNKGGRQPLWRADGKELFFVSDDRKFYAVDIQVRSAFNFGAPHFLFDMRANVFNARNSYIPSRDGQRFLVNMILDTTPSPISVVKNWTAGLRQ